MFVWSNSVTEYKPGMGWLGVGNWQSCWTTSLVFVHQFSK